VNYAATVASQLPGMPFEYYIDQLPLAIGLQFRNADLHVNVSELIPPGKAASAKARQILGDHVDEWV